MTENEKKLTEEITKLKKQLIHVSRQIDDMNRKISDLKIDARNSRNNIKQTVSVLSNENRGIKQTLARIAQRIRL